MSDQELRTLERAASADPAHTLAYARALERAGRGDDAWLLLCRAIDHVDIRAELASRPSWKRLRALEAPPVRGAPRIRWSARTDGKPFQSISGPTVLVTTLSGKPAQVRDPRTGRVRFLLPRYQHLWLDGGRLVAQPHADTRDLLVWDPWSGPALRRGAVMGAVVHELPPDGHFLLRLGQGLEPPRDPRPVELPLELVGGALRPGSVTGGDGWLMSWPPSADDEDGSGLLRTGFTTDRVAITRRGIESSSRSIVLDLESRTRVWQGAGVVWALDDVGMLSYDPQAPAVSLLSHDGVTRWSADGLEPWLLGTLAVVAPRAETLRSGSRLAELVVLDRETGTTRATLRVPNVRGLGRVCAVMVRDQVYTATEGDVVAWDLDGKQRWSLDLRELGHPGARIIDLAPLPGALVVAFEKDKGGGWLCLEEVP